MIMNFKLLTLLFLFVTCISSSLLSQEEKISQKEIEQVVDSICHYLIVNFNDKDIATEISNTLRNNLANKKYSTITGYKDFAYKMHVDLYHLSKDNHCAIRYDPVTIAKSKESGENEFLNGVLDDKRINYGLEQVKILEGNVGYIKLDRFPYPTEAGKIIESAITMVSNSDALIIDLRDNVGGYLEMVQFLTACFFEDNIHINTINERSKGEAKQFWSYPYIHGNTIDSIPVYILTSKRTFSAAEWFTYVLQVNDRAMVIGENTKGGANTVGTFILNNNFMLFLPVSKCISPTTNTNFNNTGIVPDSLTTKAKSLNIAYEIALTKLDSSETNQSVKEEYKWTIDGLSAKNNPIIIDESTLQLYTGIYEDRNFYFKGQELFYKRKGGVEYRLLPINNSYFLLDGLDGFRLEFIFENGVVTAVKGRYSNGRTDLSVKQNKEQNFYSPESVVYDSIHDRFFVSNRDGDYISVINSNWEVSKYYESCRTPRGLFVDNDKLYAACTNSILVFNSLTDSLIKTIEINGAIFLNDITIDNTGHLYVSDTEQNKVYKIKLSDNSYQVFIDTKDQSPNGLFYDEVYQLIYVGFRFKKQTIAAFNLNGEKVYSKNFNNYGVDGIAMDNNRELYFSNWTTNSIYKTNCDFSRKLEVVSSNHHSPADITIINKQAEQYLVVPNYNGENVEFLLLDKKNKLFKMIE